MSTSPVPVPKSSLWATLLPSLIPVATLIGTAVAPAMQHLIAAHPVLATVAAAVLAVVNHWIPSPSQS